MDKLFDFFIPRPHILLFSVIIITTYMHTPIQLSPITPKDTKPIIITPTQYQGTFNNLYNLSGYVPTMVNIKAIPIDNAYGNGVLIPLANEPNSIANIDSNAVNETVYNYPARIMVDNPYHRPLFTAHKNGSTWRI